MSKPIVPVLAFTAVLAIALALIIGIILRPWGDLSGTQLNSGLVIAKGYDRSTTTYVGESKPMPWSHTDLTRVEMHAGKAYFVTYGCASCHGLDGKGSRWAPMELDSMGQVRLMVRSGPGGMPEYPKDYLSDGHVEAIAAWLESQGRIVPKPTPTPTPVPTPTPLPTPTPPPTPTPAPAPPGPAPSAVPGGTPVPQGTSAPAPTPTPPPTPTPTAFKGDASNGQTLFANKKCARCHGKDGGGSADLGPALNTAKFAEKYTKDADIGHVVRKGSGDMDGYDDRKLSDQDLADIIAYIRSLRQ